MIFQLSTLARNFQRLGTRRVGQRFFSYDRRSVDLAAPSPGFFFDTHSCVKKLREHGFTEAEAESLADLLATILSAQTDAQHKILVHKSQLEIVVQELLAQISGVKKDMSILEKSEFSNLRHDTEKLNIGIKQLESKLGDEVTKLKNSFILDMNLERSRAKEDQSKVDRDISQLTNRISLEVASMHTEIANLRATFEAKRLDMVKYIAGSFFTAVGLFISIGLISLRLITH